MKKTITIALLALIISVSVTACSNTIKGIGRDMQSTGEKITDSMKDYD